MYFLAICYFADDEFGIDYYNAFRWFKESAEKGFIKSYYFLGVCYEKGKGVTTNIPNAIKWYKKAVDNDVACAMCSLGFMYELGIGVQQDYKKAFEYYKMSAERGDSSGQLFLAYCYFDGNGTPKNASTAIYWATKARDSGSSSAKEVLEQMKRLVELDNRIASEEKDIKSNNSVRSYDPSGTTVVLMKKINSLYYVPCKINGVKADFVFDTGASNISLSAGFAQILVSRGLLSNEDIKGQGKSIIADGSITSTTFVNIKDVEIGGLHLYNVRAGIKERQNAPLLLGQSAIEQLGRITIDGYRLIIHK